MGIGDSVLNPLGIKHAMDVKNWIAKNPIECIGKFVDIVPAKDGSGFISVFEFKFGTKKECEMFNEVYKLAEKFGV